MTGITPWPQAEPAAGPPRRPGAGADLAARYEAGYLPAAGSLLGDERFRGRSVLHVDPERARERNAADPAARGRDAVKVLPWSVPSGTMTCSPRHCPHTRAQVRGDGKDAW